MKTLDKYILKKFTFALIGTVIGWLVLFIIIDMVEHLDDFLGNNSTFWQITKYYIMYTPYCMILTMPISVLISVLFSVGMMAQHNEVVAMQAAGISLYRIIGWLLLVGFFISISVGVAGETFVPKLNRQRLDFFRYDIKKKTQYIHHNKSDIVIKDSQNIVTYIGYYQGKKQTAKRVTIIWQDSLNNIQKRIDAQQMKWNKEKQEWILEKVKNRSFENGEIVTDLDTMIYKPQYMVPSAMLELKIKMEEMTFMELFRFIQRMKSMGLSPHKWLTDINMKAAYPLANLIVLLIGAPLAARKRRSGVAMGMVIAFVVSFIYFFFVRIGQVLGHKGVMEPVVAAWMGNVVFLIVGIIILLKIRK
ncbi:MAG: LptF/LptG family permease [Calditrichia bacterium]|nr:LptF/LptG family permease [Calditrichia bacterium]